MGMHSVWVMSEAVLLVPLLVLHCCNPASNNPLSHMACGNTYHILEHSWVVELILKGSGSLTVRHPLHAWWGGGPGHSEKWSEEFFSESPRLPRAARGQCFDSIRFGSKITVGQICAVPDLIS